MYAGQIVEIADVETIFDDPAHPYTRGLFASNPIASKRGAPLPAIPRIVPSPAKWPVGCHFRDRCSFPVAECPAGAIAFASVAYGSLHAARCIRVGELDIAPVGEAV